MAIASSPEELLRAWEERAAGANPADAMLINRHVRELRETLASAPPSAPAPVAGDAVAYFSEEWHAIRKGRESNLPKMPHEGSILPPLSNGDYQRGYDEEDMREYALDAIEAALAQDRASQAAAPSAPVGVDDWNPKLPPLIGTLAELKDYVKPVVEAYGRACARAGRDAALAQQPAHPPGTPMMPPGKFYSGLWKSLPDNVQHHARMLTQSWETADSTELKNALEAAVLALSQQPAAPSGEAVAWMTRRALDRFAEHRAGNADAAASSYAYAMPDDDCFVPLYAAPQQPAAPSGEAVGAATADALRLGTGVIRVEHVPHTEFAAPQQPAAVDDEAIEPVERCESGLPDCGPAVVWDSEGIGACERCAKELGWIAAQQQGVRADG